MRIYHNQLAQNLQKGLLPAWLVFGDEPWQKNDSIRQIKCHYQAQGFSELVRFTVDDKFDWSLLQQEYQALSLFSDRRIIELDIINGKLGDKGSKAILALCQDLHQDILLLAHGPKLDMAGQKRKWFKTLESVGCFLPLYDIEGKQLNQWVQKQARFYQLNIQGDVFSLLAELFEGNLNALDQELQKFSILFGQQSIGQQQIEDVLIKQAKFNPFQLIDAILNGELSKCITILDQLQQAGSAVTQLIWFIHKEVKQLAVMQEALAQDQSFNHLCKTYRIWDKRKPLYQRALKHITSNNLALAQARLAQIDLLSKTSNEFNSFILLSDVIVSLYHGNTMQHFPLNYEYA
jgi:DNA polymerase-3 subunit delta